MGKPIAESFHQDLEKRVDGFQVYFTGRKIEPPKPVAPPPASSNQQMPPYPYPFPPFGI
jgi:hypothetical protein